MTPPPIRRGAKGGQGRQEGERKFALSLCGEKKKKKKKAIANQASNLKTQPPLTYSPKHYQTCRAGLLLVRPVPKRTEGPACLSACHADVVCVSKSVVDIPYPVSCILYLRSCN